MENQYLLNMDNISKEYYGNRVLKNVNLKIKAGEIHALMGENGAGKSTLMNILFGMPVIHSTGGFEGTVEIDGKSVVIDAPHNAMNYGIGMVHQEFMLIPGFTVTENIKVGREISNPNLLSKVFGKNLETLDFPKMKKDAKKALATIGLNIEEYVKVAGLPIGYMQFIEIAREIDKTGIKLLVFDEPTAVLTESEAERLLEIMRLIADKGIAIVFITHRLDEVMAIADSLTVLRDGEFVIRKDVKDSSVEEIAELMIGRKVEKLVDDMEDNRVLRDDDIALSMKDYYVNMPGEMVNGINLDIRKGEIFGIGGLAGQGKIGIPNGIMGLYESKGTVSLFGKELELSKLGNALENGIACVSEDRRGVGLLLGESIEQNIAFSAMQINDDFLVKFGPIKLFDQKKARKHAMDMIELLDIRCTGPKQASGSLSGGNQQKVCLARALTMNPDLLIVSEPTRGIDIGAKKLVLEYLVKLNREQGLTIIMVSSELVELRSLCDRIAIVSGGKLATILKPDAADAEFGLAMAGSRKEGAKNA
ncbi:sugar ABC transporter ATP-binding protein [Tissierella sp.]|uniref:sugar ABC transporter ATP-binding protein n=1 Tax=Tissierella sp. TaxID=41274 RepID=UPI0028665750|nr:sugar ABC transporter ATP-binding protein [Tissierella sp.]MDR7855563.1 sugar ABC transporter ATP-binding protein [Tissierella sp.]